MSKPPTTDIFALRTGVLLTEACAVLLASDPGMDEQGLAHTFIFTWRRNGEWSGMLKNWGAGSLCFGRKPLEQVVVVGETGKFQAWSLNGGEFEGKVAERGVFTSTNCVEGRPYIVGMGGLVYRRESLDHWQRIEAGIPHGADLESIGGFSEAEMYVVGWNGGIYWVNSGEAIRVHSPTNVVLTRICAAGDGQIYCCGQQGTLIRGRYESWKVIEQAETTEDLWDVHWFQGRLYTTSMSTLYRLDGQSLTRVGFGSDVALSCYHLSSVEDTYLMSVGRRDVMLFDGSTWTRIL